MKYMTPQELVEEFNEFAKNSEPQTEDNIVQLYFHYAMMFNTYCGKVPNFEVIDNKGTVKLLTPRF